LAKPLPLEESWYKKVADTIAREGVSMRVALAKHAIPLDTEEATKVFNSKAFQKVLWHARNEWYTEVASDPARTKLSLLGMMTLACQHLFSEGNFKDALEGGLKIAKIEGWASGETNTFVFGNVSAKEIEKEREKILATLKTPPQDPAQSN
jgi:hypothetical protein